MNIRSVAIIRHAPEVVAEAYRERLSEIAPLIPDIERVEVAERTTEGDSVRIHHVWRSDRNIPQAFRRFIRPEHLCWDDHGSWAPDGLSCEWVLSTRVFTRAVKCSGTTRFTALGEGTRMELEGDFRIDPGALDGIPSVLARRMVPGVESFISALVQPNLDEVNGALEAFLNQQEAGC